MTWTWVSVGSGNASIVRFEYEYQPAAATNPARMNTSSRVCSEPLTSPSIMSVVQLDLVVEEDRALDHDLLAGLEPLEDRHLAAARGAGDHGAHLERARHVHDVDVRLR